MTGPKLNERPVLRARASGRARPVDGAGDGARAVARYVRVSPYKVREVLDLIRGQTAERAEEILRFSERDAAIVVRKALASAVANASVTGAVPEDELFVSACFADEGPTLKRWRPRARGRATRIRKRTSHITVIVSRLPDDELQRRRQQRPAAVAERRRRRAGQAQTQGRRPRRRRAAAEEEQPTAERAEAAPAEKTPPPDAEETEETAPPDEGADEAEATAEAGEQPTDTADRAGEPHDDEKDEE